VVQGDNWARRRRTAEAAHSLRPILEGRNPAAVVAAAAAVLKNHTNWVHSKTLPAAVVVVAVEPVVLRRERKECPVG